VICVVVHLVFHSCTCTNLPLLIGRLVHGQAPWASGKVSTPLLLQIDLYQ
jgi:hypothetical protein